MVDLISKEEIREFNEKNKVPYKLTEIQQNEQRIKYFKNFGIDLFRKDKDYDTSIVGCNSYGEIQDYNNISADLKFLAILYASAIVGIILLIGIVTNFESNGFLRIIVILLGLWILAALGYAVLGFIRNILSSRDIIFKLESFIYIAPIILYILYFVLF